MGLICFACPVPTHDQSMSPYSMPAAIRIGSICWDLSSGLTISSTVLNKRLVVSRAAAVASESGVLESPKYP